MCVIAFTAFLVVTVTLALTSPSTLVLHALSSLTLHTLSANSRSCICTLHMHHAFPDGYCLVCMCVTDTVYRLPRRTVCSVDALFGVYLHFESDFGGVFLVVIVPQRAASLDWLVRLAPSWTRSPHMQRILRVGPRVGRGFVSHCSVLSRDGNGHMGIGVLW